MTNRLLKGLTLTSLIAITLHSAHAVPIIRSFHSVRTAGMGDVRYTTGEFEENFFANPARMTENPENRFQLPKLSFEAGSAALGALSDLLKSNSGLSAASGSVGKPLSARFQLVFPAYYRTGKEDNKWSFAIGFHLSASINAIVSQTGYIDPLTVIDDGLPITVARKFLEEDRLSVGVTMHPQYRASSNSIITLQQFLSGKDLSSAVKGGSGFDLDFDLGTTFKPHWGLGGFEYEVAFAINNLMNGMYKGSPKISDWEGDPIPSNRSLNFGVSATKKGWGPFQQVLFALESTDIGNNPGGSFFRTLHLGGEGRWHRTAVRLGLNQGYLAAGFGLDLGYFDLNLATYGEEMGLNAGTQEDRRYALEFGFHI